ncbi:hypothetical protein BKG77_11185 [Mycobacteroides chelonae]|nr:hypothetical protein BKG77_11185 [Mycobacteroides chelonae]
MLSVRLGSIDRITYQVSEWSTVSRRILFRNRLTHLNWSLSQPVNTISAEGADGAHLTLLIVPPDTEALPAHTTMMTAATPGNTATVAHLLPANRTEPGTWIDTIAAQNQWDSEGGAQMVEHRDHCGAAAASA